MAADGWVNRWRARMRRAASADKGLFIPVFGFPVRISNSFWLIAVLVSLGSSATLPMAATWTALVLLSILWHELGHALTASRWGLVLGISLHGAGGLTKWTSLRPLSWWKRLAISLSGPAAGMVLGLVAFCLPEPADDLLRFGRWQLVWINVGWGLFNLLPILPLDGGQALKAVLVEYLPRRGEVVTALIGVLTAAAVALWGVSAGQPWAILVMMICGYQNVLTLKTYYDSIPRSQWRTPAAGGRERDRY
jgi:Zn-dependent protease